MSASTPVWQGRIAAPLDPKARALNDSLPFDQRLWPEELELARAYAHALVECGILDAAGREALARACDGLEADLRSRTLTLEGEDVHSAVEAELARRCGDPALRLHTGRSRNDQVVTLLRMRLMRECDETVEGIRQLERELVAQARKAGATIAAAQTHLQPAQPVLLAHLWLAHVAALERDEERLLITREACDRLPLGAGAVAGTPLRYDRVALGGRLGFSRVAENSVDAVGDRDFALEYLNAAAMLGLHLSRLAEDLVLWSTPALGWIALPDGFATGSSLLPQKRNPDLFELTRGKSARLLANAQRLAITLKGLPSAYHKDLQEDKEAVFDTADTLRALLAALPKALAAVRVQPERVEAGLSFDLLAVELADALVQEGVPFREAHARVGELWAAAERAGLGPRELPESERLAISPHFDDAALAALTYANALGRRTHAPGGGPDSVAAQIRRAEARLGLGPGDPEGEVRVIGNGSATHPLVSEPSATRPAVAEPITTLADGAVLRRARLDDVTGIAAVMSGYVAEGVLLPRPVSELFQCIREFHVAERDGQIVACAALRLLWDDLGEVRSLAVRSDAHGQGFGAALVRAVIADAKALGVPRLIALTREVPFFERAGFHVAPRETMPRKVWTDCVRCPRRHACDEVAVALDLVPGASEAAARRERSYLLPIPQLGALLPPELPIVS